ncbi:hypothetical protein AYK24_02150 [Thermoplasmatales archaeon SG8-52-4]|nr:MAG: hypothetical protein AYK24_02150 [Thermoplasmatales archaeon SG8-52-4]
MSEPNLKLLDHFHNPRNVGTIEDADGYGRAKNPINEYITDIYLKVEDGAIKDIKFKTLGCTATIASASAMTEAVKGRTIDELINESNPTKKLMEIIDIKLGGIPENNWHCLPSAVLSLLNAIQNHYEKKGEIKKVKDFEKLIVDIKNYVDNYINENLNE